MPRRRRRRCVIRPCELVTASTWPDPTGSASGAGDPRWMKRSLSGQQPPTPRRYLLRGISHRLDRPDRTTGVGEGSAMPGAAGGSGLRRILVGRSCPVCWTGDPYLGLLLTESDGMSKDFPRRGDRYAGSDRLSRRGCGGRRMGVGHVGCRFSERRLIVSCGAIVAADPTSRANESRRLAGPSGDHHHWRGEDFDRMRRNRSPLR